MTARPHSLLQVGTMVASSSSILAHCNAVIFLLIVAGGLDVSAFQFIPALTPTHNNNNIAHHQHIKCSAIMNMVEDSEDVVLYADDDVSSSSSSDIRLNNGNWGAPNLDKKGASTSTMSRWTSLNPKIKERIVKEAHERAIRNKKRREPAATKKRRLYSQYREMQQQSKRDKFVKRNLPGNSKERMELSDIDPGTTFPGKVISLTKFGAYVDIGSEVDGLLHVSQITRDEFVAHPRQYLSPGDEVDVRVVRRDPTMKKLQLTMLPEEILEEEMVLKRFEMEDTDEEDDRIQLDEVEVDDELWGEIRRVTDYGAYVELGAVVRGFLHFMDHPMFGDEKGSHPKEFMRVGDRVRVWVLDVDVSQNRIKLTANRPAGLPGPRRETQWI